MDELNKIVASLEAALNKMIASITTAQRTTTFGNEDLPIGGSTHNNSP